SRDGHLGPDRRRDALRRILPGAAAPHREGDGEHQPHPARHDLRGEGRGGRRGRRAPLPLHRPEYFASDKEVAASLTTDPFYLNGRSNQRKLVLQWIEESYASKEPVDPSQLTIEHIMPRTATDAWREELAPELGEEESFEEVHQGLQHTLGNLTLTGYNSTLS